MDHIAKNCIAFLKKEIVLCIAVVLALASAFFVPPSSAYISYIDWNTLALLFSLMAVMKGFQKMGLFLYLGNELLKRTATSRRMLFVLIFLPFVFSMVITNDVSLITFVPFGMIVLRMAKQEQLMIPMVVLQTVAANLGSMLTPMGNPQNLYLYSKSGFSFGKVCSIMLPYVLVSGLCLALMILMRKSVPISDVSMLIKIGSSRQLFFCVLGFILCLLGIFKVIPPAVIAAITVLFLLLTDRKLLAGIDYSLLGTFFAFFVFIGNIGSIESFQNFLASVLTGHEQSVSILASQIISNVPAALLLSGFTNRWEYLLVGFNLGGLGTLIASMASLISYKMVAREYPDQCKKYFLWFTLCNIALLGVLLLVGLFV